MIPLYLEQRIHSKCITSIPLMWIASNDAPFKKLKRRGLYSMEIGRETQRIKNLKKEAERDIKQIEDIRKLAEKSKADKEQRTL